MNEAKNLLEMEKSTETKHEIEQLIKNIEIVQELSDLESLETFSTRQKRQIISVTRNCSALQIQLAGIQLQISTTQIRITNITINFNSTTKQVETYKVRVATANSTSNWNLFNVYLKLQSAINKTVESVKKELESLQTTQNQIQNDIQVYCTGTVRPAITSSCGKFLNFFDSLKFKLN
jgi:chromosome segregation ATPase